MLFLYLNGEHYTECESMTQVERVLDAIAEEFGEIDYTEPECGCIYVTILEK